MQIFFFDVSLILVSQKNNQLLVMNKKAKERIQFNIRLDGRRDLVERIDKHLAEHQITKTDFAVRCFEHGLAEDIGSLLEPVDTLNIEDRISNALEPILKKLELHEQRLGKWNPPKKGEDLTKHECSQMASHLTSQEQTIENYKCKIAKLEEKLANQKQSVEAFDENKFEEAIADLEAALKLTIRGEIKTRIVDFLKSISTWSSLEYSDDL